MKTRYALRALMGIMRREMLRFVGQQGRFAAAIVRPLVWLGIFAVGFRSVLGLSIIPPYESYILYEVYIVPGLVGMMLLFHGMQNSLSMVYDREMGSMRVLLTAPLPRWWLLGARLLASTATVLPIVYLFLLLARFWEVRPPALGYGAVLPALILAGLMLGAFGLALSTLIRQLENFAGVMNFVIFPMFFASAALYPLWRLDEVSPTLAMIAWINPFSHAVELIRFALYLQFEPVAFGVCVLALAVFFSLAVWGYDPGRGFWARRGANNSA
ncbi:ABC-2 type transport system permease protein [Microvirga lupini]|uniref:Transport permease protein n=1 Tax=Microvirga lupini TaxID=420324 RepID=A0A7W4VL75_9HYPH|nr:ABC transporter permease [Microvirga lupini]MBB3019181.1 ABC-2 type transport system permease protein [Microvirga lupini]